MRPLLRHLTASALLLGTLALIPVAQPATAAGNLAGIDVSTYQGTITWADVAADGIDFAYAKATEGRFYADDQYARNKERAEANGVAIGAYHFANPDNAANDAILEADNFVDVADLGPNNLIPVLDLERHGGFAPKKLRQWAKAWLARVEARTGVKAMIYTSPSFWRDRMGNPTWFSNNGFRLWIAHWGVAKPSVPAQKWAGRGWTVWQYSDCGSVNGIDGCVDLDRFKGTDIDVLKMSNNGG
ncbi:MAG: glycoside hydrolase family 25 protein [Chloroflexota bacterium]